jgi:hypothetical protein
VPEVILDPVYGIDDAGCRKVPLSSRFAGRVRDDKIFRVVLSASVSPWRNKFYLCEPALIRGEELWKEDGMEIKKVGVLGCGLGIC